MNRIGFDVDGVLASFCDAYERLFVEVTGRNNFPSFDQEVGPASWNWPTENCGYTTAETSAVWERIKADKHFQQGLKRLPDAYVLRDWFLETYHPFTYNVYFITSRVGPYAKYSTEAWLCELLREPVTVLIANGSAKGQICAGLKLDWFVEDNLDNANTVAAAGVPCYLINRAYNVGETHPLVTRISSLRQILSR